MRRMLQLLAFALLPSRWKVWLLRRAGHRVGNNVYIGPVILDVRWISLGDNVSIRGLNLFRNVEKLVMADGARIGGFGNWVTAAAGYRGESPAWGNLTIGRGSVITSRHYFDLQDGITIGSQSLVAGFGSVFYTHGGSPSMSGRVEPISIGSRCYIGSHTMMLPGSKVGDSNYVAARSVVTKDYSESHYTLLGGNPAVVRKTYDPDSAFFVKDHGSFRPHRRRRDVSHLE